MPEFVLANAWFERLVLAGKFVSIRDRFRSVYNRLKLLKLQTLRIDDECKNYSTKRSRFGGRVKHRIEEVTRCGRLDVVERGLPRFTHRAYPRITILFAKLLSYFFLSHLLLPHHPAVQFLCLVPIFARIGGIPLPPESLESSS